MCKKVVSLSPGRKNLSELIPTKGIKTLQHKLNGCTSQSYTPGKHIVENSMKECVDFERKG